MSIEYPPLSVVIIGGAYAGASTIINLLEQLGQAIGQGRLEVTLFERSREWGIELAWSGSMVSDCQLSNLGRGQGYRPSPSCTPLVRNVRYAQNPGRFCRMAASLFLR